MKILLATVMLVIASAAQAQLTIRSGENWVFTIRNGQPADAHKVQATAKPAAGQVMVTVRSLFGTLMTVTNNSRNAYTFNAELLPGRSLAALRTCTLPPGGKPTIEQWEQTAKAVRISNFRAAGNEGRC